MKKYLVMNTRVIIWEADTHVSGRVTQVKTLDWEVVTDDDLQETFEKFKRRLLTKFKENHDSHKSQEYDIENAYGEYRIICHDGENYYFTKIEEQ